MRPLAFAILPLTIVVLSAQGAPTTWVAGDNVPPPRRLHDAEPAYPPLAQSSGLEGFVLVEVTIGPDGSVERARVVRSSRPIFDAAALDAARQWTFEPTLVNGAPVTVLMNTPINFTLRHEVPMQPCANEAALKSVKSSRPATLSFTNRAAQPRKLYWLDYDGKRKLFETIGPSGTVTQQTYVGHTWVVTDVADACIGIYVPDTWRGEATIPPVSD